MAPFCNVNGCSIKSNHDVYFKPISWLFRILFSVSLVLYLILLHCKNLFLGAVHTELFFLHSTALLDHCFSTT